MALNECSYDFTFNKSRTFIIYSGCEKKLEKTPASNEDRITAKGC
jgi:hypothetical protein